MDNTKLGTILLATTLALTFAVGFASTATAASDVCHSSIDGGVTCEARAGGCEVGAHIRDAGDFLSGSPASASVDC